MTKTAARLDWQAILAEAGLIVQSYDTGVTLRQLFYRLVAAELLPNSQSAYKTLSSRSAEARRRGEFPDLIDRTRDIHRYQTFAGVNDAREWLHSIYRRDRTEGQPYSLYLGVEKNGIVAQLESWFGHLGIPILALGGYSSQSYVTEVTADVREQERPAVLIYAGDFDASGEDIDRDFGARTHCFAQVVRVALTEEQVHDFRLPPQPGKKADTRAAAFIARHGHLVQVELDALPPETLRLLYTRAIAPFWDEALYNDCLHTEKEERLCLA
ncbi:MAG: hypothetical protein ACYCX3_11575 [Thermoleophilia bacterium]